MTGDEPQLGWRFGRLPHAVDDPRPDPESSAPPQPDAADANAAWHRLLILHTPFRATEQEEFLTLTSALRSLQEVFLAHPELSAYFAESFRAEDDVTPAVPARRATDTVPAGRATGADGSAVRYVAMLQLQLMEDVFYALRLDRYANATENRGWMNLFRRWGRSPTFNAQFERLEATFTPHLGQFYRWYVRELDTIDRQPVPHRWDRGRARYGTEVMPTDRVERPAMGSAPAPDTPIAGAQERPVPGVLLDSGILAVPPHIAESARGTESDLEAGT